MQRALLIIDVQNEYFTGKLPITYPQGSLENMIKAIEEASTRNIPVILVQHTALQKDSKTFVKGGKEWEIHDEIKQRKYDYIIEKNLPSSFHETDLEDLLRKKNIDTVVICGYMTQMCCDTTARHAFHLGFAVEFLSDATGTLQISNYAGTVTAEELHRAVLITQAMRFSKVITTEELLKSIRNRE